MAPAVDPGASDSLDAAFEAEDVPLRGEEGAKASRESLLAPTDKRRFFSLSLGTRAALLGGYSSYYSLIYGGSAPFRIETSAGAHFKNRPRWGAAFVISDTLTGFFNAVQLGARIQRDRPFSQRWGIYSQSMVTLSFRMLTTGYACCLSPTPSAVRSRPLGGRSSSRPIAFR